MPSRRTSGSPTRAWSTITESSSWRSRESLPANSGFRRRLVIDRDGRVAARVLGADHVLPADLTWSTKWRRSRDALGAPRRSGRDGGRRFARVGGVLRLRRRASSLSRRRACCPSYRPTCRTSQAWSGIDLGEAKRGRLLLGTGLFVGGFTVVFVSYGALFGGLGSMLIEYTDVITRVLGVFTIVFGLAFMGLIPWLNRSWNPDAEHLDGARRGAAARGALRHRLDAVHRSHARRRAGAGDRLGQRRARSCTGGRVLHRARAAVSDRRRSPFARHSVR